MNVSESGKAPVERRVSAAEHGPGVSASVVPWPVSDRSPREIRDQAARLRSRVTERPEFDAVDVGYTLASSRPALEHRAVVFGADRAELLGGLDSLAGHGVAAPGVVRGRDLGSEPVLVFPGQGAQWQEMGRALLAESDVFARRMTQCAEALTPFVDWSVLDAVRGEVDASPLDRVDVVQPALWAVMVSLAEMWRSVGVRPAAVVGHSIGEIAAACVSGALSLTDGARVVAVRSQALASLSGGGLTAVAAPVEWVTEYLAPGVEIAAVNGPSSTVLGGELGAVREVAERIEAAGVRARTVTIDYPAHTDHVARVRERIIKELSGVRPAEPEVGFWSSVTGGPLDMALDAEYWYRSERDRVRFAEAVRGLVDAGHSVFLEVGPHPLLTEGISGVLEEAGASGVAVGTLRRGDGGWSRFQRSVAEAFVNGVDVDWDRVFAHSGARMVDLPTDPVQSQPSDSGTDAPSATQDNPLDGGKRGHADAERPAATAHLAAMPESQQRRALTELVRAHAAAVLGHSSPETVSMVEAFRDLGFDSAMAVEVRSRLVADTGLRLPATVLFDHPTPAELVERLRTELVGHDTLTGDDAAHVPTGDPDEPIAIVAMGCRYPGGVDSPEALWRLVERRGDAITEFPDDRGWDLESLFDPDPDVPGTTYVREGGFLEGAAQFDAGFFGINPREATAMDPQQRLLLEVSWETIERAGIDAGALYGQRVGVFVGATSLEYGPRMHEDVQGSDGYVLTGSTASVASGRLAYVYGFDGPAVTVDTACSSSLVALHQAAQSLHKGDCTMALAGGATVMGSPGMFVEFSRQRGLAADGRCKAFSAAADGTGWAEGVGLVLLERLSDARRNGHPVVALVRGSAVNQDGASNGLTAPSGPAQERVITRALTDAGVAPGDVDAIEAHGTGTPLGDPIEAQALLATYGQGHPAEHPVWLGSLKSNIGHAQAAAGVGGVIKMAQAMRHGTLPATVHVDEPTSHVDWDTGGLALLTEPVAWPATDDPRRAAVSSFGISGTNAHLILEEPPTDHIGSQELPTNRPDQRPAVPCLVSATNRAGVREQAARLRSHLEASPELDVSDTAFSLATTRAALEHRSAVVAHDRAGLLRGLEALAEDAETPALLHGRARSRNTPAMLFPGQGAQRPGMGHGLYATFPEYARALDEVCAHLDPHLDHPLREVMFADEGSTTAGLLDQTSLTQPALFATGVALFRLLESWGVRPDLLAGHSIGELAAAHVAGVLSLPDACALVAARGRLMQQLPATGAMLAAQAAEADVLPLLEGRADLLGIAAVNGPRSTVVSGDADAVAAVEEELTARDVKARRLRVSHAFHSPHMDSVLPEFRAVAESVTYHHPRVPIVSNLTGGPVTSEVCAADYWVRHVRETVRFHDGIRELDRQGATVLLELGPDGSVSGMAQECLPEDAPTDILPTLRTGQEDSTALVTALGRLHAGGGAVNWRAFFAEWDVTRVPLPTYAFQRRRYWLNGGTPATTAAPAGLEPAKHPLLDTATELADGSGLLCTGRLSLRTHPWLADHTVGGAVLLPATAFAELALRAGAGVGCDTLEELLLESPLVLPERESVSVQVVVGAPEDSGRRPFTVHACADGDDAGVWRRHASGALERGARPPADGPGPWPPAATPMHLDDAYQRLENRGYSYGPTFRGLRALWRDGNDILAEVALPDEVGDTAPSFGLHPALLDAVLHALLLGTDDDRLRLPFSLSGLTLHTTGASQLRARLSPAGGDAVSLTLTDPAGTPVAMVERLVTQPVARNVLADARIRSRDSLFSLDWVPATAPPADHGARVALLGSGAGGFAAGGTSHYPDLPALVTAMEGGEAAPDVVFAECPAGHEPDLAAATGEATRRVLELLQAWLADDRLVESRLVVVTRGAVAVAPGEDVARLSQASVWGLVRSAQSEHPGRFALLDLGGDTETPAPALPVLAAATAGEPQLAYREGAGLVPRLARVRGDTLTDAPDLDPRGTVLITGGTGELGALVARRLVAEHGARRLVLLSRSGARATGAEALSAELTEMGAHVTIEQCDAANRDALAAVLATIPTDHPLTMVVHTAGVLDDATIAALTTEQLTRVLAAKVAGAVNLHELTTDAPLTAFVTFSSIMGVLGGPGQGNYAAANTFLDALAQHRRALDLPGLSLAWGLWEGNSGVTGELSDTDRRRMARDGLVPISREVGQELFDTVLGAPTGVAIPARLSLVALRARAESGEVPAVLSDLAGGVAAGPAVSTGLATAAEEGLAERVASRPEAERHGVVLEVVRSVVATVLGESGAGAVAPDRAFSELGFDSLTAVELRNRLSKATGLRLPTTLVFDYPTPDGLAHYVLDELAPDGGSGDGAASLEEIDRLERTLLATEPDDDTATQVTARLQALLANWQAAVDGDDTAEDDDLDAASDDELFDLLDKELGTS